MKTIQMKRADWEKWDAALRSGKYKQCTGMLSDGGGYCCLGVLQMALDGQVEPSELPSAAWLQRHGITFDCDEDIFGGIKGRNPEIKIQDERDLASEFNDAVRDNGEHIYTFPVLADAIAAAVEFTDE